jgi:hypothetical protein
MGFNKRRMESERAAAATTEAEARRALGPQILADAEHLIATWTRGGKPTCRCCSHRPSARPSRLGTDSCGCAAQLARPSMPSICARWTVSPECGGPRPYPVAVLPLLPAARAVCRIGTALAEQHRRRDARGTSAKGARRIIVDRVLPT